MSDKKHYIKKSEFREELIKSKELGRMTEKLGCMFITLVDNIQNSFVYVNDADRKDCKSEALEILTLSWSTCDLSRSDSNPFSYFTKTVENALYYGWKNVKRNSKDTILLDSLSIFRVDNNQMD